MTDRQAKQLDLASSARMVNALEEMMARFGDEFALYFNHQMAERIREFQESARLMQEFQEIFFSGVGIPNRFLMLDSVTTINEIRDVQEVIVRSRAAIDRPRLVFKGQGPSARISEA